MSYEFLNCSIANDIRFFLFTYVVIETKYTINHVEKVNYTDRGKIKWIAETKKIAFNNMENDDEARNSNIDSHDLFPRLYFLPQSFLAEFVEWLKSRQLEIINIEHGNF